MKIKEFVNILMNYDQEAEIIFESFDTEKNEYSKVEIEEVVLKVNTKILVVRL